MKSAIRPLTEKHRCPHCNYPSRDFPTCEDCRKDMSDPIVIAYCWRSGEIECIALTADFQRPDGTIAFARGRSSKMSRLLDAKARHAYNPNVLLVPGLPELEEEHRANEVLVRWTRWAFSHWPVVDGVHVQPDEIGGGA